MGVFVESDLPSALLERWLQQDAELDQFVERFLARTLPLREWTHRAHIGVAAALVIEHGRAEALATLRETIPRYNEATGGANTETSGYHETLTVFWLHKVADLLDRLPAMERLSKVRVVVEAYGPIRRLDRVFYSFDVVASREARMRWIEPDR